MQFQINIDIDQPGVQAINQSGQTITLVKAVGSSLTTPNTVAWLAFSPFESNQVIWQENYMIYATTMLLEAGATIQMTSQTAAPAQLGNIYNFVQGAFDNGTPFSEAGLSYSVNNQVQSTTPLSFGLAQSATINNVTTLAPLNAVQVLFSEIATFTPEETISIFLSSVTNNGSVTSEVTSNSLTLTLSSDNPTANVGFNDEDSSFFLIPPAAAFARRLMASTRWA